MLKKAFINIALSFIALLLFLVFLEAVMWANYYLEGGSVTNAFVYNDKFGWVNNTKMRKKSYMNPCGEEVVQLTPTHELINRFPEVPRGKKVFFIGDSFTYAVAVSTGFGYFDHFERETGGKYQVFAAGLSGYGSLQEYMVLQSVYDEIKPDIVIWQLSGNDIINNVFELGDSYVSHEQKPRPYLDLKNNRIVIKNPGFWLLDVSRLLKVLYEMIIELDRRYEIRIRGWLNNTMPHRLNKTEMKKHKQEGLDVLDEVVSRAVRAYPDTELYGFSVDGMWDEAYEKIFFGNGAKYFREFYREVDSVEGTNCRPLDEHWNYYGNEVAGRKLAELLEADISNRQR